MPALWTPTKAFGRAILLTGVLVLLAVVLGRQDLVAIAVPFAFGAAVAVYRRPSVEPQVELELPAEPPSEGAELTAVVRVRNTDTTGFDLAVARLAVPRWVVLADADRPYATDLAAGNDAEVAFAGSALRWGRHPMGPAQVFAVGGDGLLVSPLAHTPAGEIRVHPLVEPFRADEAMPRSSALVGPHRSRRPGEGGELAGVRRYAPGDRLRRVDWRLTLRTREPYVVATWSDRDASVVLLLDVVRDAGSSGGVHGSASVLDSTVRAAAAIAEHYLRQGDRVSLVEHSGDPRHLPPGGGANHLQLVLDWLLSAGRDIEDETPPPFVVDYRLFPDAALVIVLTPLLDASSAEMLTLLARAGRAVVAVDTLGDIARRPIVGTQWTSLAQRLWWMERSDTIGQLGEVGVPVAAWAGAGSLDHVLRDLTRLATAPRMGVR